MHWMYGGSFNPPTIAHEAVVSVVKQHIGKDTLVLVPVGNDYLKPDLIDIKHRIHMLDCLHMDCIIDSSEMEFPYKGTLETLKHLKIKYQNAFGCIIGADQLPTFHTWISVETLCLTHPLLIIKRPGYDIMPYIDTLTRLKATYEVLELQSDVASKNIRNNYKQYRHHLSPCVYQYIQTHHLYEDAHV